MKHSNTLFEKLTNVIVKHHKSILSATLILFILSIFAITNLMSMKTNWKDLLHDSNPRVVEFKKIIKNFQSASNVTLALEGTTKSIRTFSEVLVNKLNHDKDLKKYIRRITYKVNRKFFKKYGLLLAKKNDLTSQKYFFKKLGFYGFFHGINRSFENSFSEISTRER